MFTPDRIFVMLAENYTPNEGKVIDKLRELFPKATLYAFNFTGRETDYDLSIINIFNQSDINFINKNTDVKIKSAGINYPGITDAVEEKFIGEIPDSIESHFKLIMKKIRSAAKYALHNMHLYYTMTAKFNLKPEKVQTVFIKDYSDQHTVSLSRKGVELNNKQLVDSETITPYFLEW